MFPPELGFMVHGVIVYLTLSKLPTGNFITAGEVEVTMSIKKT